MSLQHEHISVGIGYQDPTPRIRVAVAGRDVNMNCIVETSILISPKEAILVANQLISAAKDLEKVQE